MYADAEGIDLQERVKVILYCPESGRAFDGLVSSGLHIISWPLSFPGYLQTGGRHNACRGGPKTNSTLANSVCATNKLPLSNNTTQGTLV